MNESTLAYWNALENKDRYIRSYGEGVGAPSRDWEIELLRPGESLLDVGCGPGCSYENLLAHRRQDVTYRGYDFSSGFVDACRSLFPAGDFQVGDACTLPEPDNAWDVVLLRHVIESIPGYEAPVLEALRVARRKVVIVMWRPLLPGSEPDRLAHDGQAGDYNGGKFRDFLAWRLLPVEYREFDPPPGRPHRNYGWCLHKRLDETVFDLDDLWDDSPEQDLLFDLKTRYPRLKVTLFATPGRLTPSTLARYSALDWVELAAHGGKHDPNSECLDWSRDDARRWLDEAEQMGLGGGFRPPGWLVGDACLDELAERGWWLACLARDRERARARGLRTWCADADFRSVHGHFQAIGQPNPFLRNGIRQLVEERGLPFDERTEFKFVSEVVA